MDDPSCCCSEPEQSWRPSSWSAAMPSRSARRLSALTRHTCTRLCRRSQHSPVGAVVTPRPELVAIEHAEELPVEMSDREKFLLDMNGTERGRGRGRGRERELASQPASQPASNSFRQTDRQTTDRQTYRQTDRQTDRQSRLSVRFAVSGSILMPFCGLRVSGGERFSDEQRS